MSQSYKFTILLLILTVCACSAKPDRGRGREAKPSFTTNILADGSKRFTFVVTATRNNAEQGKGGRKEGGQGRGNRGQGGGGQGGGGQGGGGQGGGGQGGGGEKGRGNRQSRPQEIDLAQTSAYYGQYEDSRKEFLSLLDQHITEAEYCRHGYIELDYSQTQDQTELSGECQESASDEDKERWN